MFRRIALSNVLATAIFVGSATSSHVAHGAEPIRKTLPAGGGLDAVELTIDSGAGVVRIVRGGRAKDVPIAIEKSRIDTAAVTIDIVPVGEGRSVARVRVPDVQRKDLAFEAV